MWGTLRGLLVLVMAERQGAGEGAGGSQGLRCPRGLGGIRPGRGLPLWRHVGRPRPFCCVLPASQDTDGEQPARGATQGPGPPSPACASPEAGWRGRSLQGVVTGANGLERGR